MNKTRSLALGILLGIAVVVSLAIVYIDTTQNYWYVNGGFVKLIVSNQTQQAIFTVDTNTLRVGFNSNNVTVSFMVLGRSPSNVTSSSGTSAATPGQIQFQGGTGGGTTIPTTGSGGIGGTLRFTGGTGGDALSATTNATGGAGGTLVFTGGTGGATDLGAATNVTTGGGGGMLTLSGGTAGAPSTPSTNTFGGLGGGMTIAAANGGTPSAGWARKGGAGGLLTITAGNGGNGTRTNSGAGGELTITAGSAGGVLTAPGNPEPGGNLNLVAGNGSTGDTNSNGGRVHLIGGSPGSGAVAGEVVVGRNAAGTSRGGLQIGLFLASTATVTNWLTATQALDFPSIVAGAVADLPITVAGAADGDVVTLSVPISAVTNCMWMAFASNGVCYVRAANGQLVTAQDPNAGNFRVFVSKFR